MKFNEKLVMLRKQNNLSQEQLAEQLNVARQTVSKSELGETTPEMDKLIKMSEIFKISLDELMKEETQGETVNDPNNTNSQKLAGMTIKILKGIGIFFIIIVIMYIILIVAGLVAFNRTGNDSKVVTQMQEELVEYE